MRNSIFRELDFNLMENYFYEGKHVSLDEYYRRNNYCSWCDRARQLCLPYNDCIIVYLEDCVCKSEEGGRNDEYCLLLDFFTLSDYVRFQEIIGYRFIRDIKNRERADYNIPRSTFFTIDKYRTKDKPRKDAHYYLNLHELEGVKNNIDNDNEGGFPLLYSFSLPSKDGNGLANNRLLYLTQPLTYPQMVFRRFHEKNVPDIVGKNEKVNLLAEGQGGQVSVSRWYEDASRTA